MIRAVSRQPMEPMLFFLIRSLICIIAVYVVIQWRPLETGLPSPKTLRMSSTFSPSSEEAQKIARAGIDAGLSVIGATVREQCLHAPRDCVGLLKQLQTGQTH
jgi:hypothetical protein